MARAESSDAALLRASASDELRRNARIGMEVEVRDKQTGTRPVRWQLGKIGEVVSRGVFVRTGPQRYGFYHWSQVRRPEPDSPSVTLGDLVAYRSKKPDFAKPLKPVSIAPAPPPTPKPPPPPVPDPAPLAKARKRREAHAHSPTLIGDEFRRWRRAQKRSQAAAGNAVNISGSRWCEIELGDVLPSDDVLQAFAELTGLDLLALIDLRAQGHDATGLDLLRTPEEAKGGDANADERRDAQDHRQVEAGGTAEPAPETPEPTPPPPPPVVTAPPPPPPPAPSDEVSDFLAFSDRMEELAPMPMEREARKRWFGLVKELYEVSR